VYISKLKNMIDESILLPPHKLKIYETNNSLTR